MTNTIAARSDSVLLPTAQLLNCSIDQLMVRFAQPICTHSTRTGENSPLFSRPWRVISAAQMASADSLPGWFSASVPEPARRVSSWLRTITRPPPATPPALPPACTPRASPRPAAAPARLFPAAARLFPVRARLFPLRIAFKALRFACKALRIALETLRARLFPLRFALEALQIALEALRARLFPLHVALEALRFAL